MDSGAFALQVVGAMDIKTVRKIVEIECWRRGWSKKDLAAKADVNYTLMMDWFREGGKDPRTESLGKLAFAFGWPERRLFDSVKGYFEATLADPAAFLPDGAPAQYALEPLPAKETAAKPPKDSSRKRVGLTPTEKLDPELASTVEHRKDAPLRLKPPGGLPEDRLRPLRKAPLKKR